MAHVRMCPSSSCVTSSLRVASRCSPPAFSDYMYGGGYMMGTDMMMFGMLYGASDMAYYDHQASSPSHTLLSPSPLPSPLPHSSRPLLSSSPPAYSSPALPSARHAPAPTSSRPAPTTRRMAATSATTTAAASMPTAASMTMARILTSIERVRSHRTWLCGLARVNGGWGWLQGRETGRGSWQIARGGRQPFMVRRTPQRGSSAPSGRRAIVT